MKEKKKSSTRVLLDYAGSRKPLTFLGLGLSGISMVFSMAPYICVWLVVRDLVAAAPQWTKAESIRRYGWIAFAFAVGGILFYFAGLMCTHLAAFRVASNIRKQGVARVMKAPLGYFDSNASGLIRGRLDASAADTESLLAHHLADIVGAAVLFISMLVMMFIFDWRMGGACLLTAVISMIAMFSMMGGKNAGHMAAYQAAQDQMTKAGTEYVRGIPVVKIFQQTVYSFRAFKEAIDAYSDYAEKYQSEVCEKPQSINLTFTEGAFVFQFRSGIRRGGRMGIKIWIRLNKVNYISSFVIGKSKGRMRKFITSYAWMALGRCLVMRFFQELTFFATIFAHTIVMREGLSAI